MLNNIKKVLLSNLIVVFVGLVNSFIFPKLLTINDYAEYQTFLLYISYVGVMNLGLPSGMLINYGGISYDSIDKRQYKSEVFILLGILNVFSIIGIFMATLLHNYIWICVSFCIFFINFNASYKLLYQVWNKFTLSSLINAAIPLGISLAAIMFYLITGKLSSVFVVTLYTLINGIVAIILLTNFVFTTYGIKSSAIFTKYNFTTMKIGFMVMIGNFVNVAFHSIDKIFIKAIFTSNEFAYYSFAMSMQNIMIIFITSIAQPLYHKLASEKITSENCDFIKTSLLIFGSCSGIAYFVCSIFVKHFISQYIESLQVISIFFAVFPAMAVINCLYINLYKVTKQIKRYSWTLALILLIGIVLNGLAVLTIHSYISISIATTITYYIWFFYSANHFEFCAIQKHELLFLCGFLIIFFSTTLILGDGEGLLLYTILIIMLIYFIYKKKLKKIFKVLIKNKNI